MANKYRKLLGTALSQTQKEYSLIQECLQQIRALQGTATGTDGRKNSTSTVPTVTANQQPQESRRKRAKLDPQVIGSGIAGDSGVNADSANNAATEQTVMAGRAVAVSVKAGCWILATLTSDHLVPNDLTAATSTNTMMELEHSDPNPNSSDYKRQVVRNSDHFK
jgi:hypothetical protein